jgi:isopenicillin-N epimerase
VSNPFKKHWGLNPEIDFLNHGSFGASPIEVLRVQQDWIRQLESDPIEFLAPERSLLPRLDVVRAKVAELVNAPPRDLALVRNATDGVNAVLRSFPFDSGDEVLVTNHGYNACNNAAQYAASRFGAKMVVAEIPFPIRSDTEVLDAVAAKLTNRTRLVLIDHVTSPTGLVMPVREVVGLCRDASVRVMIDGAHAPGMLPVDLGQIGADYYVGNHHKWLCAPKTSGFLYVAPQWQPEVRPTTISHGANNDRMGATRFQAEFNWTGTFDPSPLLSVPAAIDFIGNLYPQTPNRTGLETLMINNRSLALAGRDVLMNRLNVGEPAPSEMIGSLATVPLPHGNRLSAADADSLRNRLFTDHRIEVPVVRLPDGQTCVRISAQAYNSLDQYERLGAAINESLSAMVRK